MRRYRITIAESITYRQFVCEIDAETEEEAKEIAKKILSILTINFVIIF